MIIFNDSKDARWLEGIDTIEYEYTHFPIKKIDDENEIKITLELRS